MKLSTVFIIITLLLVFLKVGGFITISWLWCFSLIWIPFALVASILGLCAVVLVLSVIVKIIDKVLK